MSARDDFESGKIPKSKNPRKISQNSKTFDPGPSALQIWAESVEKQSQETNLSELTWKWSKMGGIHSNRSEVISESELHFLILLCF